MALLDATPGRPLINYNYVDFAEGTGIVVLYGVHNKINTTDSYILTKNVIFSNDIETEIGTINEDTYTKRLDIDFDLAPFNLPKNLIGTATLSIPFCVYADPGTVYGYVIAKLRKWNGSSEIEIASAQSETIITTGSSPSKLVKKLGINMTIPLTHFKKGETLRLTIEGWAKTTTGAGASHKIVLAHDPKERATGVFTGTGTYKVTTSLIAHIPFRLGV